MDFKQFYTGGVKRNQKKHFKVTGSWGVYQAYKLIRKNHWFDIGRPLTEKEFYAIIRGVNKLLAENIANGISVKFPERIGELELRKHEAGVSFVNDKLKVTYPIDWASTWRLWYEDPEAYKQKVLKRDEHGQVFYVKYLRNQATYDNKTFYQFVLNRSIKQALKKNIKQNKVDTLYG